MKYHRLPHKMVVRQSSQSKGLTNNHATEEKGPNSRAKMFVSLQLCWGKSTLDGIKNKYYLIS